MKSILLTVLASTGIASLVQAQEFKEKATFIGYDTDFKTYTFEAEDGDYLEFEKVDPNVMAKYKLTDKTQRGKDFLVEYDVEAIENEMGDIIEVYILSKMSPTVIIKNEEEEEDDDF